MFFNAVYKTHIVFMLHKADPHISVIQEGEGTTVTDHHLLFDACFEKSICVNGFGVDPE